MSRTDPGVPSLHPLRNQARSTFTSDEDPAWGGSLGEPCIAPSPSCGCSPSLAHVPQSPLYSSCFLGTPVWSYQDDWLHDWLGCFFRALNGAHRCVEVPMLAQAHNFQCLLLVGQPYTHGASARRWGVDCAYTGRGAGDDCHKPPPPAPTPAPSGETCA